MFSLRYSLLCQQAESKLWQVETKSETRVARKHLFSHIFHAILPLNFNNRAEMVKRYLFLVNNSIRTEGMHILHTTGRMQFI